MSSMPPLISTIRIWPWTRGDDTVLTYSSKTINVATGLLGELTVTFREALLKERLFERCNCLKSQRTSDV